MFQDCTGPSLLPYNFSGQLSPSALLFPPNYWDLSSVMVLSLSEGCCLCCHWWGKDRPWPSQGEGKNVYIKTSLKTRQNNVNHRFYQTNIFLPFTWYSHGLDLLYTCFLHLQGMQIIISMLFKFFTFKDPYLAENLTNLADTPKIVGLCRVHGARFFQLQGPLTLGGTRATPSVKGSGGQDCWGKVEGQGLVEPCLQVTLCTVMGCNKV